MKMDKVAGSGNDEMRRMTSTVDKLLGESKEELGG